MNIILKIFLISFILIGINYPVLADGKTKIEVNVYMQLQPIERNLNTKEIKMMKSIAERQWSIQNEKGIEQKDYYNIGLKQFSDGKYDDCIKSLKLELEFYGNHTYTYYLMGLAYLKKQDYINAIEYFNIAINKYRLDIAQIYYARGLARYYIKDYEGAIEDFNISEKKRLNLNETKIVTNEFIDYKNIINGASNKELYSLTADINPKNYFVLYPMNNTAIKLTSIAKSKSIELYTNKKTIENIAKAYKLFEENLSKNNIEKYDEIIKLNPDFIEAYNNRGILNLKNKNYTNAIKDLKRALQIDPNNKDVIFNLALSHYSNGNYNNAILYIDKYFQLDDYNYKKSNFLTNFIGISQIDNEENFYQYFIAEMIKGNSLLLIDKISEAKIIFNQFDRIYPAYYLGSALISIKENDYKKAVKIFKRCLLFEYETKHNQYNGMEYKEKSADYVSNFYAYNNIAISEYLKENYSSAYANIKKAAYLSFLNNDIVLYSQTIILKNLIKSKLTQHNENKANKEYNKFYTRNKNAIELKEFKEKFNSIN